MNKLKLVIGCFLVVGILCAQDKPEKNKAAIDAKTTKSTTNAPVAVPQPLTQWSEYVKDGVYYTIIEDKTNTWRCQITSLNQLSLTMVCTTPHQVNDIIEPPKSIK